MKADSSPIRTAGHCGGYKKTGKFHSKLAGFGGRGWIRTTEAEKQQIYSLPPLATRELVHIGSALIRCRYPVLLSEKMELVDGLEPPTC